MKHVLIIAVASVGVAELLNTSVSEPAAWAVVLAGIGAYRPAPDQEIDRDRRRNAPLSTLDRAPATLSAGARVGRSALRSADGTSLRHAPINLAVCWVDNRQITVYTLNI